VVMLPPTLTERPNRRFSDHGFTLPDPPKRGWLQGENSSKNLWFGLSVRIGGGLVMNQLFCTGRRARKVDIRLPGKGNSNSHGARPVNENHLGD
jgi:hypothetical protein